MHEKRGMKMESFYSLVSVREEMEKWGQVKWGKHDLEGQICYMVLQKRADEQPKAGS
jgi:hypothetical protein